jgi:hypothetical protein
MQRITPVGSRLFAYKSYKTQIIPVKVVFNRVGCAFSFLNGLREKHNLFNCQGLNYLFYNYFD